MKRLYTAPDGTKYPLTEAQYDMGFKVYKSDRKKAVIGDPEFCLLARGIRRLPDVKDVFVGSGRDAYVVFKGRGGRPDFALHFTILVAAAKVRDSFDGKGAPSSRVMLLRAPTRGHTLASRSASNKARREAVKNGAPVKKQGAQRATRIMRLGLPHRPRPVTTMGGVNTTLTAST